MLISFLPHSANVKFVTEFSISLLPLWLPLLPHSPLGLSKCSSDSEPLPMQFLLPEIPISENCLSPSFISFQFLLKCLFLSQRPSYLKLYLTHIYFPSVLSFFSTASFAFLPSVFPSLDYKLHEGFLFSFSGALLAYRTVTHTWQEISK